MGFGANAMAQDLLANQAPIDRKLKSVDSLALAKKIAEDTNYSEDLYTLWNNEFVNAYANVPIPNNYTIDLTGFCMPTDHTLITDVYGYRPNRRRNHYGLDIKVYVGDTIRAAFDGKVRIVKNQGRHGYGKYIVIRHNNGLETVYGHLSRQLVSENEEVKAGDVIGLGGNTGRSTGSHLHFETRFMGIAINPAKMFNFEQQDIVADTYVFRKGKDTARPTYAKAGKQGARSSNNKAFYKVRKGDSLARIASRKGITVQKLCKLNGLTSKSKLRPGQVIRCS